MPITITVDPKDLARIEYELRDIPNGLNRVMASAVNDAVSRGRGKYVNAAAEITTAKKKLIRSKISGARKATAANPAAEIKVRGTPIRLRDFKYKGGKRRQPLAVEMIRGRSVTFADAFIGVGPQGGKTVLMRTGAKAKTRAAHYPANLGKVREKVKSKPGISIKELFEMRPDAERKAENETGEIFAKRLLSQVDRILERRKADR